MFTKDHMKRFLLPPQFLFMMIILMLRCEKLCLESFQTTHILLILLQPYQSWTRVTLSIPTLVLG